MSAEIKPIDSKTHDFHFDVWGCKNAEFKVFNHDYRPVHGRVDVPFAQDIPEHLKAVNPSAFTDGSCDPYLAIAELRKKFQGKNRKLAGFMILARGLKGPRTGEVYTTKQHPPFKKMVCSTVDEGMYWNTLQDHGVSRMATLHLSYYLAFAERRLNYYKVVSGWREEVAEGNQEIWSALKTFQSAAGMKYHQWDDQVGRNFIKQFPTAALQREALMLPGIYKIPMNHKLKWSDMELCMKNVLEDGVKNDGFIGYGMVDILACDTEGACTMGCGEDRFYQDTWAHWGNHMYHSIFETNAMSVIKRDFPDIPDFNDRFNELGAIYHNAFGFNLKEYFGRKIPPNTCYMTSHNRDKDMKRWMGEIRDECREKVKSGEWHNNSMLLFD